MKSWLSNPIARTIADIGVVALIMVSITFGARWWVSWVSQNPADVTTHAYPLGLIIAVVCLQNFCWMGYVWWRIHHTQDHQISIGMRTGRWFWYSILGVPLVIIGNVGVSAVFLAMGIQHNQSANFPLVPGDTYGQIGFALAAAVIAPIGEEIVFRGYLLGRLQQWLATPVAIVVSALLFAGAHAFAASTGVIVIIVGTFVMGYILGWLRLASRSIWPSVIAHMANNGLAVAATTYCINHPDLGCTLTR